MNDFVNVPHERTEAMRLVPDRVLTETLYWMARAYERVHSMPRVSDTELANKIEAAKADLGRARDASPILSNSAAPAPEGGSVKGPGGYLVKDFAGGWYWTPNAALDHASGAPVWSVADSRYETDPPALATREEAPEETKEQLAKRLIGEALSEEAARNKLIGLIEQWDGESEYDAEDVAALADDILDAFNGPPVMSEGEVTADGLRSVPDDEVLALLSSRNVGSARAHLARIINALRAQPPAREDAQPVARLTDLADDAEAMSLEIAVRNYSGTGASLASDLRAVLCTRPDPDALRAVAAALKPFAMAARGLSSRWGDHETHWQGATSPIAVEDLRRADQALAALQAEQGAK